MSSLCKWLKIHSRSDFTNYFRTMKYLSTKTKKKRNESYSRQSQGKYLIWNWAAVIYCKWAVTEKVVKNNDFERIRCLPTFPRHSRRNIIINYRGAMSTRFRVVQRTLDASDSHDREKWTSYQLPCLWHAALRHASFTRANFSFINHTLAAANNSIPQRLKWMHFLSKPP